METDSHAQLFSAASQSQPGSPEPVLMLKGVLTVETVAHGWHDCLEFFKRFSSDRYVIDASELTNCDENGIAMLSALIKHQEQLGKHCQVQHLKELWFSSLQEWLRSKSLQRRPTYSEINHSNINIRLGIDTVKVLSLLRENIMFVGETLTQVCRVLRHPRSLRWKDMWRVASDVGPDALVLIALVGFLMGLISAFQAAIPMKQFGVQLYIANLVGISLVRELGPLMTAVILAGRTASSFAAEIGSMKINQEVDALKTMGLKPILFLVVPRILATTIMTPMLNVFLIFFGLIGCAVVMWSLGFTMDVYIRQLQQIIHWKDFVGGMVKAFTFGILIAGVGCLHGLKTKMGASAVGYSTTRAVVTCIILVIVVDGIFACLYYALGV